jgi:hypothetical protein
MEMRRESKKREMEKERNGGKCGREVEKDDRYGRWQELVDLEAGIFEPTEEIWDSEKLRDATDVVKLLNEQDKEIKTLTKLYDELNKKYIKSLDKLLEVQEALKKLTEFHKKS